MDENESIAKINKMHYLRDSLRGAAFRTISKLPASNENYDVAWAALQDKYHNKRAFVNDCLKNFLFHPEDIRNLIDTTKESLQYIETLDVNIDHWDPIIVYVTKLDNDTKIEWEKKLGGSKEIPKYIDMLEFLETQHRILNTPTEFKSA